MVVIYFGLFSKPQRKKLQRWFVCCHHNYPPSPSHCIRHCTPSANRHLIHLALDTFKQGDYAQKVFAYSLKSKPNQIKKNTKKKIKNNKNKNSLFTFVKFILCHYFYFVKLNYREWPQMLWITVFLLALCSMLRSIYQNRINA